MCTHAGGHGHQGRGGCSSAKPGGEGCSGTTCPLPVRLGQQHPEAGAWVLEGPWAQQDPECCRRAADTHRAQ